MRQSVVLLHKQPSCTDHFDWLIDQPKLDADHRLLTFRSSSRPDQSDSFIAQQAPDHRAIYLNYEGPISNNRGEVTRINKGEVLRWDQGNTRISALIQWPNQRIKYTALRENNSGEWTFIASSAPSP